MHNSTGVPLTAWNTDFTWRATEFVFKELTVRWWYLSLQRWLPWRTESHPRPKRRRHLRPLEGDRRTNVRNLHFKQRLWMMNRVNFEVEASGGIVFFHWLQEEKFPFCTFGFQKHKPTIFRQQVGRFFSVQNLVVCLMGEWQRTIQRTDLNEDGAVGFNHYKSSSAQLTKI